MPVPESLSKQLEVFSAKLEPSLLVEIEKKAMLSNHQQGDITMKAGQPVWGVPLVLNGVFKVTRVTEDGQELLLYYVRQGETCAMAFTSWMTTQISSINSCAEADGTLVTIPGTIVDEWLVKYPSWKRFVMNTVLDSFTEVVRSIDDVVFRKTDDRLVRYLKGKSNISGSSLVNVTHQQIADELGTNRVVVSRLLKKLETDGRLLLYRNQIKLLRDL